MTDAPALVLVPMDATEQIRRAVEAGNALYTGEAVWQKALSASPFIDGVPVEVVERCAQEVYWRDPMIASVSYPSGYNSAPIDWQKAPEYRRKECIAIVRTVLRAAGIKVADNG
jgi:hypothetical protein